MTASLVHLPHPPRSPKTIIYQQLTINHINYNPHRQTNRKNLCPSPGSSSTVNLESTIAGAFVTAVHAARSPNCSLACNSKSAASADHCTTTFVSLSPMLK